MEGLQRRGADLGLTPAEVEQALSLGRSTQDLAWYEGGDLGGRAQRAAQDLFESERVLEYQCYDSRWQTQGRGVVALQEWEDRDRCLFTGLHGPASDGYYQYYVDKEMGTGNGLYHICNCDAIRCKLRKERGDQRELIHIDRWRLQTPLTMVDSPYLKNLGVQLGEKALSQAARDKKSQQAPFGSGLDEALLGEADPGGGAPSKQKKEEDRRKEKERSRSPLRGASSMARYLTRQVAKQGESKATEKKKKKKESDKKKKEKKKKTSSSSSTEKSESSSFQIAPARGGELWRTAQKKPGQLTKLALDEMTRYLADRVEDGDVEAKWRGQKICAHLSQILLVTHPPAKMGLRTLRELQTLSVSIDHLLAGRVAQATDTLVQRLKACEMSLVDGNWAMARHLEIIPPSTATLVQSEERELAAKQELRNLKLKESMKKVAK